MPRSFKSGVVCFLFAWLAFSPAARSLTLAELRDDVAMTPEKLLHRFADFKFKLGEEIQAVDSFLAAKAGDCDDFATLAASVLVEKGYTPKLIAVFMEREVHVVCYIVETKCYLDYNNRKHVTGGVTSDGTLADIAQKVASSFRAPWSCASEFSFKQGKRKTLWTEFRQTEAPPRHAAPRVPHNEVPQIIARASPRP